MGIENKNNKFLTLLLWHKEVPRNPLWLSKKIR